MFHSTGTKKYGNKRITVFGHTFDSQVEAEYYEYLLQRGDIGHIVVHPTFVIIDPFESITGKFGARKYIADFDIHYMDGTREVVDIKGMATTVAQLKRVMFATKYRDIKLTWLVRYKGEFVDWFENEERKRSNRKRKKEQEENL